MHDTAKDSSQAGPDELVGYLDEASIRLAVFGEFSAGKTTVLNALIGEEILSVAVEPTTAVPTRVRYGREFNIFVERTDGEQPALFEDDPPFWTRFVGRRDTLSTLQKQQGTIRDFLRTWTKEGERADEVERVVIELPLGWLKGGLELVDTPGVNNEFARHQGFTEQEAGAADIAVLLMDARQGGGKRTEFEFMNEVQRQVERCIVAPNKMDLIPEGEREEFLGYIRETALPKHWDGAVTPPVMGISALAALHPDEHGEPSLVAAFNDLRDRLERVAEEERGKLLLSRKGNPEKQLFARAKELEGEEHYGRAHRLYFDLLDVLEAAGLDPTPAEEGIARCEEHLSEQVDALDTLNERYNEAMDGAGEDLDAALKELRAIREEKEDLRLKDGDLHASIEELEGRIEERDRARRQIRKRQATVENHRQNENWIDAAEEARNILPLLETAKLPEETAADLRHFVEKQEKDRDHWARQRWKDLQEKVDACVEAQRYLDAEEYLDELETVAPYTPFEEETAAFAEEVREKAELESEYRLAVQDGIEEANLLRSVLVFPDDKKDIEAKIDEVEYLYKKTYGDPNIKNNECSSGELIIDIDQKLEIALQIQTLSERSPEYDRAAQLVEEIRKRRQKIRNSESEVQNNPENLVTKWPDHPQTDARLESLVKEGLPFLLSQDKLESAHNFLKEIRGTVSSAQVDRRIDKIEERIQLRNFQDYSVFLKTWTVLAVISLCAGVVIAVVQWSAPPLILVGVGMMIILSVLYSRRHNINKKKGIIERNILKGIKKGDEKVFEEIEKCENVDFRLSPEEYDGAAYTPLMLAVRKGIPDVVEALLNAGANPRYRSSRKFTPLIFATYEGNAECVKILIDAGSNVDAKDKNGFTALDWAEKKIESDGSSSFYSIRKSLVSEDASRGNKEERNNVKSSTSSNSKSSEYEGCCGVLFGVLLFLLFAAQFCG